MKASPALVSFNAGEFSPLMDGRVDLDEYRAACASLQNFWPKVQGPAVFRPGTRFVTEVVSSANRSWLARFEKSVSESYIIEFADLKCRFYTNHGAVLETAGAITNVTQANPGVVSRVAHGYSNGDKVYLTGIAGMTQLNGRFFTVAGATANDFQLSGENTTAYTAYSAGGTVARVYTIVSPYAVADLVNSDGCFALSMVQTGDVVYIAHPSYAPRKLTRTSAASWAFASLTPANGPFQTPAASATITLGATTGSGVAITSGSNIFQAAHVGMLMRIQPTAITTTPWEAGKAINIGDRRRSDGKTYQAVNAATTGSVKPIHESGAVYDGQGGVQWTYLHPGYGVGRIASYTNPTTATIDILSTMPNELTAGAVSDYQFGAWGTATGAEYPRAVCFFRERLCFAGTTLVWMSEAGSFESFAPDFFGQIAADNALTVNCLDDRVNTINWISPAEKLLVGTTGGQFIVGEITDSEALGPANVSVKPQAATGTRALTPTRIADSTLFPQRAGRRMLGVVYSSDSETYEPSDLSVYAEHITYGVSGALSGIIDTAWQQEPNRILWCVLADGKLIGLTFDKAQRIVAWHPHEIGGDGVVESVRSIPSPTGDRDDLWLIVKRTINGSTKRYIEWMEKEIRDESEQVDAFHVDCGLTYDSTPTTSVTGLNHLEGKSVTVMADGASHPNKTVAGGAIALDRASSVVQVGLGYTGVLTTMRVEAGAGDGTAQGKTKRIHKAVVRFLLTLGGKYGATEDGTLDAFQFRTASDPMDEAVPLFTGDKLVPWPAGYETDGRMTIVQDQPFPMTVVGIFPQVTTQDSR